MSESKTPELILENDRQIAFKAYLIFSAFFLCFLFTIFWEMKETLIEFPFFNPFISEFKKISTLTEKGFFNSIIFLFIKYSFFLSPILILTFTEFILGKSSFINRIKSLSLYKVFYSGNQKYSDIWYWIFEAFLDKFSFIVTFLTLGTSVFYGEIQTWFNSLYKSIITIDSNSFNCSIIIIIAILLGELTQYISHRISHEIPFIWDFHEVHHSAKEMTILSAARGTPLEGAITLPLLVPISALSGLLISQYLSQGFIAPLIIYTLHSALSIIFETAGHSSFKIVYPKPFRYIYMSPALHWLHHSDNPDHYNCNYSNCLTIWDMAFGTYKDEKNLKDITSYGVKNSEYNKYHPLYSMTILPIVKLRRRINQLKLL